MENTLSVILWFSIALVVYAYLGYGVLLLVIIRLKRLFMGQIKALAPIEPFVTVIVPCYNEQDIIADKIANTLAVDYPKEKMEIIFISDGSTDETAQRIAEQAGIKGMHEAARKGKAHAMNRAVREAQHPIIIFTDANTRLNTSVIKEMVKHYADPLVGAVSGEKRLYTGDKENASAAGEGIYWKYESLLKRWDAELMTIVGAAGELFSVKKELYTELEEDTILDDFMQTLRIAGQGYRVAYEPQAYALETASVSVKEELKRKIRICAGGWQSMVRLAALLNIFRYPVLSFQYISHRVLRWSLAPICLILAFVCNALLATGENQSFYWALFMLQCLFYSMALLGWYLENRQLKVRILFVPYYFFIMNYAVIAGFFRYINGKQSAAWERAKRA